MNHSINYSGFIDLAMEASSIVTDTADNYAAENYTPALATHLRENNQIAAEKWGGMHHPIQSD